MDKYYRYLYYFLTGSVLVFAALYVWVYISYGDFAKGEFEIVNNEPYSIHIEMIAKSDDSANLLFKGSIEAGVVKKFDKFVYGHGVFNIKLNKKIYFSIGDFDDKNDFVKRLIIKDDLAYFEAE